MLLAAAAGAAAGLVAGSFIGVIGERWPRGEQVVRGRSHCDSCGRTLGPLELVPLVSWLAQRGRCRGCGAAIPVALPIVELGAAAIGALVAIAADEPLDSAWLIFGWMLLALAYLDLKAFWLPDRLTLPLMAAGLAVQALVGEAVLSIAGAAIGWSLLVLVAAGYRRLRGREGLGGGDPKLLGAIGAWLGPGALPIVLFAGSGAGLVAMVGVALAGHQVTGSTRLPFGFFLAVGAALYMAFAYMFGLPAFGARLP